MGAEINYQLAEGEKVVIRHPTGNPEPRSARTEEGIVLPASYTDGPYRARLMTDIRNRADFSRASDAIVAFEALRRLGYGEELGCQLGTRLSAIRAVGQPCDLATLTEETEKAKQEILDKFYPKWRELVQSN